MRDFKDFLLLISGIILWIFFVLPCIAIPIYLPLILLKWTVNLIAMKYRPDLIKISRTDSFLTTLPSDQNPVVNPTQIWKLEGKLNLKKFQDHFYSCFLSTHKDRLKYQNFYCYFVEYLSYIFKRRIPTEELDLTKHIREIYSCDLETIFDEEFENSPKITSMDQDESVMVDTFIGKWMARNTFPKGRPSWEILIIQPSSDHGLQGSVLCFKIDHGLSDGYSFVHIVEKLTGIKSPYVFPVKPKVSIWRKIKYIIQVPSIVIWLWSQVSLNKDLLYPLKVKRPEWFISLTTLDLNLVKEIRRKTKTHFVSVLISAQTGALRRFFLQSGRVLREDELPKTMGIAHSLGWPDHPAMTQGGGLCNHLTLGGFHIPLKEDNPLERLFQTEKEFTEYEQRGCPELINWIMFSMLWVQPGCLTRYLINSNLGWMRFSHLFSSLMCSSQPYELLGLPVNSLYLPVVSPTISPNTSIFSVSTTHSGKLNLSINASSEVFKNQQEVDIFTQVYFKEEIENLAHCCGIQHN